MKTFESSRSKRSRRVLLWALAFVAGAQLAVGLLLDYRWPLLKFAHARYVLGRLEADPVAPDAVILGSSRMEKYNAGQGYPDGLAVLNASVPGGDHAGQEAMWDCLRVAGVSPRLVLLEVGPMFLAPGSYTAPMNAQRLLPWHAWPAYVATDPSAYGRDLGRLLACRLMPAYHYRDNLRLAFLGRLAGPVDSRPLRLVPLRSPVAAAPFVLPSAPPLTQEVRQQIEEDAHKAASKWLAGFRVVPRHEASLHRVVAACRQAGAEVVLVTPPLTSHHRACYTPLIEAEYQRVLASTGCRHVDCRDWMEDGWFEDSHHLTGAGGTAFARKLAERVLVPWMREARMAAR